MVLSKILPILLKLKSFLPKLASVLKKNPLLSAFLIILVVFLYTLLALIRTEKELAFVKASKPDVVHQVQTVKVQGPKQIVERIVYRSGPKEVVERVIRVASQSDIRGVWESKEFDHNLFPKKNKVWSVGYSYLSFSSPGHMVYLGREILGNLSLTGGFSVFPRGENFGYNVGVSFRF